MSTEIETVEELDALPVGTPIWCADGSVREVMRASGHAALRGFDGGHEVIASRIAHLLPARRIQPCPTPVLPSRESEAAHAAMCDREEMDREGLVIGHDAMYEAIEDSPNLDWHAKAEVLMLIDHLAARQPTVQTVSAERVHDARRVLYDSNFTAGMADPWAEVCAITREMFAAAGIEVRDV